MDETLISAESHAVLWAFIALGVAVSIYLEQKYRWAARLSGPVVALLIAMALSSSRILPGSSPAYDFVGDWLAPLSIPLLLFRANLKEIFRVGGRLFFIFHLSAVGTLIGVLVAFAVMKGWLGSPTTEMASGMMMASYIGGGVNFMAMKSSYDVPEAVANPLIVADNFVMAAMFVLMLGIASNAWIRKRFPHPHSQDVSSSQETGVNSTEAHWKRKDISLSDIAWALGIAFGILALAKTLQSWITAGFGDVEQASLLVRLLQILCTNLFVLLTMLTLFVATFFSRQLEQIHGPEELGAYMLLVFLFTLGLPADLFSVLTKAPSFFVFCGIIAGINLLWTLVIGKLFKLNIEEIVIAVNANLGGAPSAAAVAISAGWNRLVFPGILVGIWGYVIGTPMGILIMELLV